MADNLYRVSFLAKPIVVHAPNQGKAIAIAIEYLKQPGSERIVVETANSRATDKETS